MLVSSGADVLVSSVAGDEETSVGADVLPLGTGLVAPDGPIDVGTGFEGPDGPDVVGVGFTAPVGPGVLVVGFVGMEDVGPGVLTLVLGLGSVPGDSVPPHPASAK